MTKKYQKRATREERETIITLSLGGGFSAATIARAVFGRNSQKNRQRIYSLLSQHKAQLGCYRNARNPRAVAHLVALLEGRKKTRRTRKAG